MSNREKINSYKIKIWKGPCLKIKEKGKKKEKFPCYFVRFGILW